MDTTADLTGRTLGKYKVLRLLGRGGMAEVYLAHQTTLDRPVALKVMLPFLAADPEFGQRFEREAKSVGALRHPNIIQVFDFEVLDGRPCMVMEYVEGESLKHLLEKLARRGQTLPLPQALRLAREVAQALAAAHRQGVVHRDVKPGNILLDKTGRVILSDFGVAKMVGWQTLTATGSATGTPAYMAPEQALGAPVDQRADLYALGVIIFQLVTGRLPFEADTALALMLQHAHAVRPSPRRLRADLPEGLERVILTCLARDPAERFPSAESVAEYLANPGAAAQLVVPPSALTPGDPAAHPLALTPPTAAPAPLPPAPAETPPAAQDVARTLGRSLREIACYHCTGAGLELEPDGRARCGFCDTLNALAGPVCPRCEHVSAAGADLCAACGLALLRTCPGCETRNWSGAERCASCGRPLDTLSALMDRAGDPGERFHQARREQAAVAAQEAAGARRRLEDLEAIDLRRQATLAAAQARKAQEQRVLLIVGGLFIVALVAAVVSLVLLSQ